MFLNRSQIAWFDVGHQLVPAFVTAKVPANTHHVGSIPKN